MNDYLIADEEGIKEVHCMNCGVLIRERRTYKNKPILRTLSNYALNAEIELEENGKSHSVAHPAICKKCNKAGIDKVKVLSQMNRGWEIEMEDITKMKRKDIDEYLNKFKKVKIHSHKKARR